jgi:hypothetical protein
MGVQHTFGGLSRVAYPIAAGILIDRFGVGVPFWLSAVLVLATLPLTGAMAAAAGSGAAAGAVEARQISAADITGEIRVEPDGDRV